MKILMVCLGNICRSPLAEGVLRDKFRIHKIKGTVGSAGMIGIHAGEAPDSRAITVAQKNNIDISQQKARHFNEADFNDYDLILAMDQSNERDLLERAINESQSSKIHLFLKYAGMNDISEVPDPYYGGRKEFELAFQLIDDGCERIAMNILQQNHD